MKFSGLIRGLQVKPTNDAGLVEVKITAKFRRGLPDQLARLMNSDVNVEITEAQLELPGTEEENGQT